jgi:hypothetical protein
MRGVDTPVIPVTLPMDGQRVWLVTSLDGLSPHHFLARAPWRIERRLWLGGILVLELTDEAGPDGPTIARPATAPMGTGASTLTHGTGPHIRD